MLSAECKKIDRDKIIKILENKYGIVCSFPKFINERWNNIKKKFGVPKLKNTKFVTDRLLCPIMHSQINEKQENYISAALISCVESYFKSIK